MLNKKILVGSDVISRGGVDTYIIQLVQKALQENWDIEVVMDRASSSLISQKLLGLCPIHKGYIYHRNYSEGIIKSYFSLLLQQVQPALVHLSCGIPWSCLYAREITLKKRIPLQFTEHYVPDNVSSKLDLDTVARLTSIYDCADDIIHVSNENLNSIRSKIPSIKKNKRQRVIFNGIDLKTVQSSSISYKDRVDRLKAKLFNKEQFKFLCMSRLTVQKGINLLIEAIRDLEVYERKKFTLDIYGEGTDYKKLKKMILDYDLSCTIKIHHWSNNVYDLFAACDLFIFPSRNEGLPFTLLEALGSGISVITSNIPVHQSVSNQGMYAQLFEDGNKKSLAYSLRNYLNNPLETNSIIVYHNCCQWLKKYFDKDTNLAKTLKTWEQLISA